MNPIITELSAVLGLVYFVVFVGLVVYCLVLATRFVKAHQVAAEALQSIAARLPIKE